MPCPTNFARSLRELNFASSPLASHRVSLRPVSPLRIFTEFAETLPEQEYQGFGGQKILDRAGDGDDNESNLFEEWSGIQHLIQSVRMLGNSDGSDCESVCSLNPSKILMPGVDVEQEAFEEMVVDWRATAGPTLFDHRDTATNQPSCGPILRNKSVVKTRAQRARYVSRETASATSPRAGPTLFDHPEKQSELRLNNHSYPGANPSNVVSGVRKTVAARMAAARLKMRCAAHFENKVEECIPKAERYTVPLAGERFVRLAQLKY